MRKLTILFAIFIFALSFSAFKKNDKAPSKTAMIAAKTWKMSGYRVDPAFDFLKTGNPVSDIYRAFPCYHDDTQKFEQGGVYTTNEGADKCGSMQSEKGNWFFDPSETILIKQTSGESFCVDVIEISPSILKYAYKKQIEAANGDVLTLTFYEEYTAQ
jgi:hypothetical protein